MKHPCSACPLNSMGDCGKSECEIIERWREKQVQEIIGYSRIAWRFSRDGNPDRSDLYHYLNLFEENLMKYYDVEKDVWSNSRGGNDIPAPIAWGTDEFPDELWEALLEEGMEANTDYGQLEMSDTEMEEIKENGFDG